RAVGGGSRARAQVRARDPGRGARAVDRLREAGGRQGPGGRHRDHRERRQGAVPGGGEAGVGQVRPALRRPDQAHPGGRVSVVPLARQVLDALYWGCVILAGTALVLISAVIPWAVFTRYQLNSAASWPEPFAVLL